MTLNIPQVYAEMRTLQS